MATYQEYLNKIKTNSYNLKARVELLRREDESVYKTIEGDIIKGGYSITNENGVRRTCNITLDNSNGEYIPDEYNLWINSQFLLSIGVECNENDYFYVKIGSFVIQNPTLNISESDNVITINGIDKFAFLNGTNRGTLGLTYEIGVGQTIDFSIRQILDEFNILKTPIIHSDYASSVTPYSIIEGRGGVASTLTDNLQGMVSSNVYFNTDGRFVFEPDYDDSSKGVQWHFKSGDFHYRDSKQELDYDNVKNSILVIGDNINGAIYDALAQNTNLQSPTRISLIGEKLEVIEDTNINTTARALLRAEYELKRKTALYSSVQIDTIPIFDIDVDKVIELTEPKLKLDKERFLVESIDVSFGGGVPSMSVSAVKTSELVLS